MFVGICMFFRQTEKGLLLNVRLTPNAAVASVKGIFIDANGEEFLKIFVVSVPEKGKANKECIDLLAKFFKISKSNIKIVSGETDRYKKILIDMTDDNIVSRLMNLRGDECLQ